MNNQKYKSDGGKLRLDLVPPAFIEATGEISEGIRSDYRDFIKRVLESGGGNDR